MKLIRGGYRCGHIFKAIAFVGVVFGALQTSSRAADAPAKETVYPNKSVIRKEYGRGPRSFWLYEPGEPQPENAPVVVMVHGWLAVNPGAYGAWIHHLARSGSIVIYPRYQADAFTDPNEFLPNTIGGISDALDILETGRGHVRPDLSKFAIIGHSAGGNLAVQIAAVAGEQDLPRVRAVICLLPGEVHPIREPSFAKVPAETLLVVAVAENDIVVGDVRARQIFRETTAIPPSRKKFILYRTDLHGIPRLIADHLAPTAALAEFDAGDGLMRGFQMNKAEVNAFDKAGFWRVADLTMAAAFEGKTLDEATDHGQIFAHLGYWSDGRVVNRPIVGDDLGKIPRVFPNNGVRLIDWAPWEAAPTANAETTAKANPPKRQP